MKVKQNGKRKDATNVMKSPLHPLKTSKAEGKGVAKSYKDVVASSTPYGKGGPEDLLISNMFGALAQVSPGSK